MSFEWRTEEEQEKEVQPTPEPASPASPPPWLRRLLLLLVGVSLVGGLWLVWQQLQERVAEVEANETEGVLASERLAQQAAAKQDQEMLRSVLSGRDPGWLNEQYRLLAAGLLLQEVGRLVSLQPHPKTTAPLEIAFEPDLRAAQVVVAHTYTATESNGSATLVTMAQTRLYRRGRERWLLSPPEDGFWGTQDTVRTAHLAMSYPTRDREIAVRLADDIDSIVAKLCALPDMACPPSLQMRINLASTAESVWTLSEADGVPRTRGSVDLPAPTLIGIPQDEASYQALLRGYAVPVIKAAVTEVVDYRCCAHVLLYRATVDWELSRLGLQPWPAGREVRELAVDYLERPGQLQELWEIEAVKGATPVQRGQAYAAVELLLAAEGAPVGDLQRALEESENMASWVRRSGIYTSLTAFTHSLRRFLFTQIEVEQQQPPLPEQDLLASCREGAAERLYLYEPKAASWTPLGEDYSVGFSANGNLLWGAHLDGLAPSFAVWLDGRRVDVRSETGEDFLPAQLWAREMADPKGQYLAVHMRGANSGEVSLALVDINSCSAHGCPWLPISTLPLWSPDGGQLLWSENGQIWRQARETLGEGAAIAVSQGHHPFWLAADRYGYIRRGEVVTATVAGNEPHPLSSLPALLAQFDNFGAEDLVDILSAPGERGPLALYLDDPGAGRSAVLLVEGLGSDQLEVSTLVETKGRRIFAPPLSAFSPDGRWLALHTSAVVGGDRGEFLLYDLRTGDEAVRALAPWWAQPGFLPAQQFAWSADGRWLARVATHQIDLLSPVAAGGLYRQYLQPPAYFSGNVDCEAVGWVGGG